MDSNRPLMHLRRDGSDQRWTTDQPIEIYTVCDTGRKPLKDTPLSLDTDFPWHNFISTGQHLWEPIKLRLRTPCTDIPKLLARESMLSAQSPAIDWQCGDPRANHQMAVIAQHPLADGQPHWLALDPGERLWIDLDINKEAGVAPARIGLLSYRLGADGLTLNSYQRLNQTQQTRHYEYRFEFARMSPQE